MFVVLFCFLHPLHISQVMKTPSNRKTLINKLKSKLQKMNGLKYENLQENIVKAIQLIPRDYYKNMVEGVYHRKDKYIPKNKTRKMKKHYL